MLDAKRTEGKDQAFINVQNNIAPSRKEDPPRGFEMIMDKMNIKYFDRQDEMNDKCCKPSASSAWRTASATSQVHHPSKENSKCYQQEPRTTMSSITGRKGSLELQALLL